MILIISNIADEAAPEMVNLFPAGAASLITASDFHLSFQSGIFVNDFSSSSLTLNGYTIKPTEITGVIITITGFIPIEFYRVTPTDREYVCTEINSFVNYFLSVLTCRKMNPPNRKSLTGLGIQKIEWVKIAESLKIPIAPFAVKNGKYEFRVKKDDMKIFPCTIIGDHIIEKETDERVQNYVISLARLFSIPYLTCYFSIVNNKNLQLMDINSIPDISNPQYRNAIANYFLKP